MLTVSHKKLDVPTQNSIRSMFKELQKKHKVILLFVSYLGETILKKKIDFDNKNTIII